MRFVNGVLLAFCVSAVSLWGQGSTAQISGTIRDATGAGVPSADIRVTQTATGLSRAVLSGEDGGYVVPNLPVGPYLVQVSKAGFSKYVQSGLVLQVGSNSTVDAVLQLGSTSSEITIRADASMIGLTG